MQARQNVNNRVRVMMTLPISNTAVDNVDQPLPEPMDVNGPTLCKPTTIKKEEQDYVSYYKKPWPTANPLFTPLSNENSFAVKRSMLRWLNIMPNGGNLEDFHNLIQEFLKKGYSAQYCTKVLKTIASYQKKRDPHYINPLKDNNRLVSYAYSNACKINYHDGKYYTETGEIVTADFYRLYKIRQKAPVDLKHMDEIYYAARKHILKISAVPLNLKPILCISKPKPEYDIYDAFNKFQLDCKSDTVSSTPLENITVTETYLLICLLFESGARSKEFLDMRIGQAKQLIERGYIHLMCKTGLNDFYVNHNVREYLKGFLSRINLPLESYLFSRHSSKYGKSKTDKVIRKAFRQIWKNKFGRDLPPQAGFHMFRHYFAVRSNKDNAQLMMRHESAQSTEKYRKMFGAAFTLQQQIE